MHTYIFEEFPKNIFLGKRFIALLYIQGNTLALQWLAEEKKTTQIGNANMLI